MSHFRYKIHLESSNRLSSDDNDCVWTIVQEEIVSAVKAQSPDDESQSAKSWCSKIAENIPMFETWLGILSDGDYGTVVYGVFELFVGRGMKG